MLLAGAQADRFALLVFGLGALVGLLVAFRSSIRVALVCWLLTIGFVPVWLGLPFVYFWVPATVIGILVLVAALPWNAARLGPADGVVAAFAVACLIPVALGGGWSSTSVFVVVTQWMLAFTIGRVLPGRRLPLQWVYATVSFVMGSVALLALVEFLLHWNPFVSIAAGGKDYQLWGSLQQRGGILRAEGAFGHSIALGCSLALAVPLALGSGLTPRWRGALTVLLLGGAVVSFSRVGILAAFLGVMLSVAGMSRDSLSRRARAAALALTVLVAVVVVPLASRVFTAAGEETARSAAYRTELLGLLPTVSVVGYSSSAYRNTAGELQFLGFKSIDSALILLGLTYGWLALMLALVLLFLAVVPVVRRRAAPPAVALVAQVPALVSVALITQYGMFLWFVAGLAAAAAAGPVADRDSSWRAEGGRVEEAAAAGEVSPTGGRNDGHP